MGDKVELEITVDDKGSIVIKNFKDVVNKSMGEISAKTQLAGSSMSTLFKSMALGTAVGGLIQQTFGGIQDILKSSTQEFMNSAAVHADMVEAMKDAGLATESNIAKFDAFADSILATTTIGGEMTRTMLTLGMTMKVPNERLEESVRLAIGLGKAYAASGLDSISAMKGVAAAMLGNYSLLSRYIPALAAAKTEQEKWAIVQKVGIDGFRREEESIKTDLGAWKQFGNYVNDFKGQFGGVLVGIIKFLVSMKEAILVAAAAMGVLFVIGKINAWVSALKAGEGALMLIVQQAQMLQKSSMLTEGIGRVSAYAQSINYASGQVVGISGVLQKLPAVGAAAFVGWEIGKLINETLGLGRAIQWMVDKLSFPQSWYDQMSASGRGLSDHARAGAEAAAAIRGLGQELGVTSGSLRTSAAAILQNKEAFNKLPPEIQAIVTRLGTIPQAVGKGTDALSSMLLVLFAMNPAFAGMGKALDLVFKNNLIEAFIDKTERMKAAQERAKVAAQEHADAIKKFNDAIPKVTQSYLEGWIPAQVTMNDLIPKGTEALGSFTDAIKLDMDAFKDNSSGIEKWMSDWSDSTSTLDKVKEGLYVVDQALADMGITLGPQAQAFRDAADGAVQMVDGLTSGDPLEVIGGAIKVVTSLFKAFAGDGIGEAIKREQVLLGVNAELIKQIKDLAKTMGDTHAATSVMLNDVIDQANITTANFDTYVSRIEEILSDYDRHALSLGDTTKEIGESFTSLIAKAKELGTEGSASMLKLIDDLNSRGIKVKEIQDYIAANWKMGLEGYKKYLEGDFSKATIGVFEYLLSYEKKVGANQALVDGVKGITLALISMSNVTKLTEEEFGQFELAASDAFKKLTDSKNKNHFSEKEALMQLQPMLSRMIFLNKEYGLGIDAATQALIDKAKAAGIDLSLVKTQEELMGEMAGLMKELVDLFKNAFPHAVDDSIEALKKFNRTPVDDKTPTFPGQPNPKNPPNWEPAAEGMHRWVTGPTRIIAGEGNEPEYIDITPQSKLGSWASPRSGSDSPATNGSSGGGSKTWNLTFHIPAADSPEQAADNLKYAIYNNVHGVKSLLEEL